MDKEKIKTNNCVSCLEELGDDREYIPFGSTSGKEEKKYFIHILCCMNIAFSKGISKEDELINTMLIDSATPIKQFDQPNQELTKIDWENLESLLPKPTKDK